MKLLKAMTSAALVEIDGNTYFTDRLERRTRTPSFLQANDPRAVDRYLWFTTDTTRGEPVLEACDQDIACEDGVYTVTDSHGDEFEIAFYNLELLKLET